ncbi:MAG: cell surface protein SprA [Muribaculaceae bacterium]|nr:cell surface protein SprA [Muribaculaceae bacterium]
MKIRSNKNLLFIFLVCGLLVYSTYSFLGYAQYVKSTLPAPPPVNPSNAPASGDTIPLPYPVAPTVPRNYQEIAEQETAVDLKTPSNIKTEAEYDPVTGCYVIRTKMGDMEIATPFMLSSDEYNNMTLRQSMIDYYRQKNAELAVNNGKKEFNFLDMNFALGPLEKVFGPGGVQLKTQGSVTLNMGIKSNKTDNPAISVNSRRTTYFDFDQKIQATIAASVGDKLKFNMSYNTDATFDFDSKNLKLQYEGKEDEIIKNIEAGNVSMTTGSSLIKGSTALFGIKTKLQFGKLTATALVSQQNSETKTVNTKGGVQTTTYSINCDSYDQNRHFFLSHFFRDNYDTFASKLPIVSSGVSITRIEVWVTNKRGNYNESRNFVGFMDLGENKVLANSHWVPNTTFDNPANNSNSLLSSIKADYPNARYINQVSQALEPLSAYEITGGKDYEKVESARLLSSSDYTLNSTLGYIMLKTALNADEVLAVAYQYTYKGSTYQVGEFSGDITQTDQSLYLKMLKGTTASPKVPMWKLMMKNVYSLGGYQIQKSKFKFNIKYLSDTTGTEISYLPVTGMNNKTLLQVMNLDRLDNNNQANSDGYFDFIEGYTIISSNGKIIFPVAEPFGSHLAKKISDPELAKKFVFQELYDSTIVVARQMQDKNKFTMSGEYQASSGSQIRLNAMNVPRGSVVVTAGGVTLTENSDYTVDYNMGTVTIINQSIIDAGTSVSVSLENQSMFSTQRKTLLGLDLNYAFNKNFNIGATVMHFSEKSITEKVGIGQESINNTIWGLNLSYNSSFMWATNLLNKIPTVNATAPSTISLNAEFAQLIPHKQQSGTSKGSSYIDDFETTQTSIDMRSPYSWFLASTPYDSGNNALFPEAGLSNNIDYGKNRALLSWYYIDRIFTQKNSSLAPGYIRNDLEMQSNPYIREITSREIYPDKELNYGESSTLQTLNLSFYPKERGPYNLDAINIDEDGNLLNPEKRWGGIMRKMDNTNFETSNIEYIQFWLLSPFLDPENPNSEGGDLYLNLGEVSEDILKDGMKSYENGLPINDDTSYLGETVWGKVSKQTSLTYAFDNTSGSRIRQDVGLDGLKNDDEFTFSTYKAYVDALRSRLPASTIALMEADKFSPLNDPAGDNYHFYRGYDYDEERLTILQRYKRYNGVEGNSLPSELADDALYQTSRSVPDVEDINYDNTLNEYERYFQYKVSLRPEDLAVGNNFITDKQVSTVILRNGKSTQMEWYQFRIPIKDFEKTVGSINDFSTIRFMRMFMTGFKAETHLRFASLELVRGEWRPYEYNLNTRADVPADGTLDVSAVNIEENSGKVPVNYVLPPGVDRVVDSGQAQATQLNEQSMSLKITDLKPGDARAVYKNTTLDLRLYKRLQMFNHAEALINEESMLSDGDLALFVRLGSDVKQNYYEYEIPLKVTPAGKYNTYTSGDRYIVWPQENMLDCAIEVFTNLKTERNEVKRKDSNVTYATLYSSYDPSHPANKVSIIGNPTLSDVRVMLVGVRNKSSISKAGTVWVNELKVTEFDEKGGWAAKGNMNIALSDIATINVGAQKETVGFGSVDQSLTNRRTDDLFKYNVAVQVDLGRFLPEKVKLKAPIYYSISDEKVTPEYNPLDQDILLKDALDACATKSERDSIKAYSVERKQIESFSISGLKFDIQSKNPMPWDPANFTLSYSSNKQRNSDPTNAYENTSDYRGSFQYSYNPYMKPFTPFSFIKNKSKNLKFIKDWDFRLLPTSIGFYTNISRYYYEQQTRNEIDVNMQLPVSVSKNFIWDRQFQLTWNFTKQLSMSFNSNTTAHIDEPIGAVNKRLFPDKYKNWKDSVFQSIKNLGTPWAYNQTFNATYKAPFSKIPCLDFLTGSVTYNATYKWDRGATIEDVEEGNTITSQSSWNADARFNFEQLFNKSKYLREINSRFSSNNRNANKRPAKAKKFERTYQLKADTTFVIKHNLKTKKVKITAMTTDGKPLIVKSKAVDDNNIEILNRGTQNVKFVVTEILNEDKNIWSEMGQYTLRFIMMPRNFSFRWRSTQSLTLPQFSPNIGDIFGQSTHYDAMAPGVAFAFGFENENYITKARERGWLMCDETQTSPALSSRTSEFNFELNLEPIKGLKIVLTSNRTDSRTSQIQFMYDNMPTTYSGSYTKTHCAITTALGSSSPDDNYHSNAFDSFINNISTISQRINNQYVGTKYPNKGFISQTVYADQPFDPTVGAVNNSSSDVLIPAFVAAYSGKNANTITLNPFPGLADMMPNWRVTYDGLSKIDFLKKYFKTVTLTHAYQCTYSVGAFSSFQQWVGVDGDLGYTLDELTQRPIPSSPFNISSVSITEKFAPLLGVAVTMHNNLTLNAEYRDSRTLTLNSSAGQMVEAATKSLVIGGGYKIANFNTVLKMKGSQQGVSNDLTFNLDCTFSSSQALIRRIESNTSQATSGTKTFALNLTANYILSKRITVGAYFDHQINTPIVSTSSYPTTNSNYGISINLSLTK